MELPPHPDQPDAATVGNPLDWILGPSNTDLVRTPFEVTLSTGVSHRTTMVRHRTTYGNYRLTVDFDIDTRAVLYAMAENRGMRLAAESEDTSIAVTFPIDDNLRDAAALMLAHCPCGD